MHISYIAEHLFLRNRSSLLQMFFKISVLIDFANFTGKHLCWSLFLIKLQSLKVCNFIKNTPTRCFPVKFAKYLNTLFLQNIYGNCFWRNASWWLLLPWKIKSVERLKLFWYEEVTGRWIEIKFCWYYIVYGKGFWSFSMSRKQSTLFHSKF